MIKLALYREGVAPDMGTAVHLPTMSEDAVANVRLLEEATLAQPQVPIKTTHTFHAGMYIRTISAPAGVVMTGAQIKVPTVLIISGDVLTYGDDGTTRYSGYNVTLGQAGRKQAVYALTDTQFTMIYPTNATTVEEAEEEFTDEYERLGSRKPLEVN